MNLRGPIQAMVCSTFMGLLLFRETLPIMAVIKALNKFFTASGFFAMLDKAFGNVLTVSTLLGMWSFRCLIPLMTDAVRAGTASKNKLDSMQQFLLMQMLFSKLGDNLLPRSVETALNAENGTMPEFYLIPVISGFDALRKLFAVSGFFAMLDKAYQIAVTALLGMWSFKCLILLMMDLVRTRAASQNKLDSMQQFLLLQMLLSKLSDKLLPLFVKAVCKQNTRLCQMPASFLVLQAFALRHPAVPGKSVGLRAYEVGPLLYFPVNFSADLPCKSFTYATIEHDLPGLCQWLPLAR